MLPIKRLKLIQYGCFPSLIKLFKPFYVQNCHLSLKDHIINLWRIEKKPGKKIYLYFVIRRIRMWIRRIRIFILFGSGSGFLFYSDIDPDPWKSDPDKKITKKKLWCPLKCNFIFRHKFQANWKLISQKSREKCLYER